jgi:hypothetical protein
VTTSHLEKKIAAALADKGIASSNLAALIAKLKPPSLPPMTPPRRSAKGLSTQRFALIRTKRAKR